MENQPINANRSAEDEESFVRLLAQHEHEIRRYIVSITFDHSSVDDIMQEAAVALWKRFDDYDPARPFVPWACRFAYFHVLKFRAKVGRSKLVYTDKLVELLAEDYEGEREFISARRRALEYCLSKLSRADRELVEMRYDSTETVRELASSRKTSVHKLYHALERVRRSLLVCTRKALRREGYEEIA